MPKPHPSPISQAPFIPISNSSINYNKNSAPSQVSNLNNNKYLPEPSKNVNHLQTVDLSQATVAQFGTNALNSQQGSLMQNLNQSQSQSQNPNQNQSQSIANLPGHNHSPNQATNLNLSTLTSPKERKNKKLQKQKNRSKIAPSNINIAKEFVRQYYTVLNKNFNWLYKFYGRDSTMMRSDILDIDSDSDLEEEEPVKENKEKEKEQKEKDNSSANDQTDKDDVDKSKTVSLEKNSEKISEKSKKFKITKEKPLPIIKGQTSIRAELSELPYQTSQCRVEIFNIDVCDYADLTFSSTTNERSANSASALPVKTKRLLVTVNGSLNKKLNTNSKNKVLDEANLFIETFILDSLSKEAYYIKHSQFREIKQKVKPTASMVLNAYQEAFNEIIPATSGNVGNIGKAGNAVSNGTSVPGGPLAQGVTGAPLSNLANVSMKNGGFVMSHCQSLVHQPIGLGVKPARTIELTNESNFNITVQNTSLNQGNASESVKVFF